MITKTGQEPDLWRDPELTIMQTIMRLRCSIFRGKVETAATDNQVLGWSARVVRV